MRIVIFLFTGTGNTLRVARSYQEAFLPHETVIHTLPTTAGLPEGTDITGFGFPVHAFNAPEIVARFLSSLPEETGRPCFLFSTSGEGLSLNEGAFALPVSILKRKGFRILSGRNYLMPYNMVYKQSDALAKKMDRTMQALVPLHAKGILSLQEAPIPVSSFHRGFSALFRIEWWYARHQKLHIDKKACNKCGKCIKGCPTKNINVDFSFGNKCTLCVRCAFSCPVKASHLGLIDFMRVTGSYDLDRLEADESIPQAETSSFLYKWLYKSYFEQAKQSFGKGNSLTNLL